MSRDSRRTARWAGQSSAYERQLRSEFVDTPVSSGPVAAKPQPWTAKHRAEMEACQHELSNRFASMDAGQRHADKLVVRSQLIACCETDFEFRRLWKERFLPHVPKPDVVRAPERVPRNVASGVRKLRLDNPPIRPGATDWAARLAQHDAKKQKAQDAAGRRAS